MTFIRKWSIARSEIFDEGGVAWLAEARAGTGVWVIREDHSVKPPQDDLRERQPSAIRGAIFDFAEDGPVTMLTMTPEQRAWLGMSDATYQSLNVELRLSFERHKRGEEP